MGHRGDARSASAVLARYEPPRDLPQPHRARESAWHSRHCLAEASSGVYLTVIGSDEALCPCVRGSLPEAQLGDHTAVV